MLNTVLVAGVAAASAPTGQATPPPLACRTNALDKDQRQRQQALLDRVRQKATAKHDLPNGLALIFPTDVTLFRELAEWISLERRCCPFLEFALEWKVDDSVAVRLTGQPGVKEAIAAEMGIAAKR